MFYFLVLFELVFQSLLLLLCFLISLIFHVLIFLLVFFTKFQNCKSFQQFLFLFGKFCTEMCVSNVFSISIYSLVIISFSIFLFVCSYMLYKTSIQIYNSLNILFLICCVTFSHCTHMLLPF